METLVALVGLGGAVLGAATSGVFAQIQLASARRSELLSTAYMAFIEATAAVALEAQSSERRANDSLKALIAAKQRILYFAPKKVVRALAEFDRTPQVLGVASSDMAYAELLAQMRRSLGLHTLAHEDVYRILVGRDSALELKRESASR
jgi:hypothetical protein